LTLERINPVSLRKSLIFVSVYGFLLKDKKSLKPICCRLYFDSIKVLFYEKSSACTRNNIETQITRFWVQGSGLRITNTKKEG